MFSDDIVSVLWIYRDLRVKLLPPCLRFVFYGGCRPHTPAFYHSIADSNNYNYIATAEHLLSMRSKCKHHGPPAPAKVQSSRFTNEDNV
jgi:hypothetical protein